MLGEWVKTWYPEEFTEVGVGSTQTWELAPSVFFCEQMVLRLPVGSPPIRWWKSQLSATSLSSSSLQSHLPDLSIFSCLSPMVPTSFADSQLVWCFNPTLICELPLPLLLTPPTLSLYPLSPYFSTMTGDCFLILSHSLGDSCLVDLIRNKAYWYLGLGLWASRSAREYFSM